MLFIINCNFRYALIIKKKNLLLKIYYFSICVCLLKVDTLKHTYCKRNLMYYIYIFSYNILVYYIFIILCLLIFRSELRDT